MINLFRFSAGALPVAAMMAFTIAPRNPAVSVPESYPILQPGSPDLSVPATQDANTHYRIMVKPSMGDTTTRELGTQSTFEMNVAGQPHRVSTGSVIYIRGVNVASDTLLYDGPTLRPITERLLGNKRTTDLTYDGKNVTTVFQQPDSAPITKTQSFPVNVFAFNELDQIIRFMPHREGVGYILPLYSEGDRALEYDTVAVTGRRVGGAWIVRFADPAIVTTYDVDDASRKIVNREVFQRKTKNHLMYADDPGGN